MIDLICSGDSQHTIFTFYDNRRSCRETQFLQPFSLECDGRRGIIAVAALIVYLKSSAVLVFGHNEILFTSLLYQTVGWYEEAEKLMREYLEQEESSEAPRLLIQAMADYCGMCRQGTLADICSRRTGKWDVLMSR